jgi:hypothetical protein
MQSGGGDQNPLNDLDEAESELDSDSDLLDEAAENLEKLPPPPDPIPDPGPL